MDPVHYCCDLDVHEMAIAVLDLVLVQRLFFSTPHPIYSNVRPRIYGEINL